MVELLVAITILGILVGLMFDAFKSSSNLMMRNANKTEVNQVVRAVMEQVSRDIERATYQDNITNMFAASPGQLFSGISIYTNSLYLLADMVNPDPTMGTPVNVGYGIVKGDSFGQINKWVLERCAQTNVDTISYPGSWWTTMQATDWSLLSENVIGIQFSFFTNLIVTTSDTPLYNWSSNSLPYSVGVTIYTIDSDSYNRAITLSTNLSTPASLSMISNNVNYYYTRVFVPNSSQNP